MTQIMGTILQNYNFVTYDNNEELKSELLKALDAILCEFNCSQIKMPVFTCTNELLVNAIKANYKNLYFEEYSPQNNALEIIPYHKALQLFKLEMSTKRIDYLLQLAKKKGVTAVIDFKVHEPNVLEITVTNPAEMTEVEQENVHKKISIAAKFTSLTEYFLVTDDDPNKEGGGLGLIFIMMMLKSFGLFPTNFKIYSENNQTVASIKIPLCEKTISSYLKNTNE